MATNVTFSLDWTYRPLKKIPNLLQEACGVVAGQIYYLIATPA